MATGRLSTHVLDTARGKPAAGVTITLYRIGATAEKILQTVTNADGRTDAPLLAGDALTVGVYELVFEAEQDFVPVLLEEVTRRMSEAGALSVPLVVDSGVGDNWDEAH